MAPLLACGNAARSAASNARIGIKQPGRGADLENSQFGCDRGNLTIVKAFADTGGQDRAQTARQAEEEEVK
jgi:hypothetical protein